MSASKYPFLFATLGEAATRLPDDLARTLESTLAATQAANTLVEGNDGITLLDCLQRIRQGDAADGQPWPAKGHTAGQRRVLASLDRANAAQTYLLELLHAIERARVDGDEDQHVGDSAREALLLACRALSEHVGGQLRAA